MYWLFLSVLLYAINNILWKIFVKGEQPLRIINRRAIFTVLIAFSAVWFTHVDLIAFITNPKAFFVLLASLFGTAGLVMMVTFLKDGSLVRMGYYSLMGSFIAAGYTYLFRETPISQKAILGTILIIIGYLVFLFNEKRQVKTEPALLSQHLLLGSMTLCFSLSLLIQWESLKIFPPLAIIITQEITVLVATFIALLIIKPTKIQTVTQFRTISKTAIMAVVIFAGIFVGTIGLKQVNPFLASITGISVPILTVFAASFVFRDKLNLFHLFSLLLMIIGGLALL
jgi:drug/metabolite transporter (DMT)-like permease